MQEGELVRDQEAEEGTGHLAPSGDATYLLPWGHPEGWPPIPNGARGRYRAPGENLLGAATDREAVAAWLSHKGAGSAATLKAYQREVTRLLLWAAQERNAALSDLSGEDYQAYKAFLSDPRPADRWVMSRGRKRAISDPAWRPFCGALAPQSRSYALRIIRDLLGYLTQGAYLVGNPLAFIQIEERQTVSAQEHAARSGRRKALSPMAWSQIKEAVNRMPEDTPTQRFQKARARWLYSLLFALGPRVGDLLGRFGDFHVEAIEGNDIWIWSMVGKGGKFAQLPVPPPVVEEMKRFRRQMGIPPLPSYGESTPLIPRVADTNRNRPQTRQGIDRIIKGVLRSAADHAEDQGQAETAEALRRASTHSLRHTAAKELVDAGVSLRVAGELLRHADIRTTQGYTVPDVGRLFQAMSQRNLHWE